MKKKTDFSNPFADDLADFKSVARSLLENKQKEFSNIPLPTGRPSSPHAGNAEITLDGEPIGRRGRQQQQTAATPLEISTFRTAVPHNPTPSIVNTPALHDVSSIATRRNEGRGSSTGQQVLFQTELHLSSNDSTSLSVFPITKNQHGFPTAVKAEDDDLEWLRDDSRSTAARPTSAVAAPPRAPLAAHDDSSDLPFLRQDDGKADAPPPLSSASPRELAKQEKEKEKNDLYAELEWLDMEINASEKRIEIQQIKEETELLDLETTLLNKKEEERKTTAELDEKINEAQIYRTDKLEKMSARHQEELEEAVNAVAEVESSKFKMRLKGLQENYHQVWTSVCQLKEQEALLRFQSPYDRKSIVSALLEVESENKSVVSEPELMNLMSVGHTVKDTDREGNAREDHINRILEAALKIVKDYCDRRCNELRDHVVEHIHKETLQSAHKVRSARETSWLYEAINRKTELSEYIQQSLSRYLVFFRERASLKERNTKHIREMIRRQCEKLRQDTSERLRRSIAEVTAKMNFQRVSFEAKMDESIASLSRNHDAIRGQDAPLRLLQTSELEKRLETEYVVRQHLFTAQKTSLQEQLQKLRRGWKNAEFQEIRTTSHDRVTEGLKAVQTDLLSLKEEVTKQLDQSSICTSHYDKKSTLKMRVEELEEVLTMVHSTTVDVQLQCRVETKRCQELLLQITGTLNAVFATLKKKRLTQHSEESKLEFVRNTWELEHRKALGAPEMVSIATAVPVGAESSRGLDVAIGSCAVVPVYADPCRATVTATIQALVKGLQLHATRGKFSSQARGKLLQTLRDLLSYVRGHCHAVEQGWANVMEATLTAQSDFEAKSSLEARLIAAQGGTQVERAQMEVEQQELADELRRLEAIQMHARGAADTEGSSLFDTGGVVLGHFRKTCNASKLSASTAPKPVSSFFGPAASLRAAAEVERESRKVSQLNAAQRGFEDALVEGSVVGSSGLGNDTVDTTASYFVT